MNATQQTKTDNGTARANTLLDPTRGQGIDRQDTAERALRTLRNMAGEALAKGQRELFLAYADVHDMVRANVYGVLS